MRAGKEARLLFVRIECSHARHVPTRCAGARRGHSLRLFGAPRNVGVAPPLASLAQLRRRDAGGGGAGLRQRLSLSDVVHMTNGVLRSSARCTCPNPRRHAGAISHRREGPMQRPVSRHGSWQTVTGTEGDVAAVDRIDRREDVRTASCRAAACFGAQTVAHEPAIDRRALLVTAIVFRRSIAASRARFGGCRRGRRAKSGMRSRQTHG